MAPPCAAVHMDGSSPSAGIRKEVELPSGENGTSASGASPTCGDIPEGVAPLLPGLRAPSKRPRSSGMRHRSRSARCCSSTGMSLSLLRNSETTPAQSPGEGFAVSPSPLIRPPTAASALAAV
eukprot:CAMPEP_0176290492 /NCGR_PEP_ID=MMETSP0121_2-20121125/55052_1 /TAXON_ID=160619 /ORGANISM="Kryptoperidinium foliaceum, Strain CCMP 1326" /LENGTH=122 /DNA_ID=CAMNT_0017631287 /DNA_START=17 /DNA_END=382 /DNA_ORIENTATION=+